MTILTRSIPSIMSTDPGPQNTFTVGFENILFIVCETAIIYCFSSEEQSRALAETPECLLPSDGEWMLFRGSISPCPIPFLSVSHPGLCSRFHLNTQEAFIRQDPVRVLSVSCPGMCSRTLRRLNKFIQTHPTLTHF